MKFALLTRVTPGAVRTPRSLEKLEHTVMERIRPQCPSVEWLQSYAAFGPFDYLDLIDAPDVETAARAALLLRTYGHARVELLPLIEWDRFKTILEGLQMTERDLDL